MPVISNDCYELLGVPVDAPRRDIAEAWQRRKRELAERFDGRSPGEIDALLSRLDESFRILVDPERADRYRRYRALQAAGRRATHPEDVLPLGVDDAELEDGNTDLDATDSGLGDDPDLRDGPTEDDENLEATDHGLAALDSVDTLDDISVLDPPEPALAAFDPDRIRTVAAAVVPQARLRAAVALVIDEPPPDDRSEVGDRAKDDGSAAEEPVAADGAPSRLAGPPLGPSPEASRRSPPTPPRPPWIRTDLDETEPELAPLPAPRAGPRPPRWGYASAPAAAVPQAPPARSPGPLARVDSPPWIR
jgi:hypothetical protein